MARKLLSKGHPLGATGLAQCTELVDGTLLRDDRQGLERLCRYGARGPVAESRLRRLDSRSEYSPKKGVAFILTAERFPGLFLLFFGETVACRRATLRERPRSRAYCTRVWRGGTVMLTPGSTKKPATARLGRPWGWLGLAVALASVGGWWWSKPTEFSKAPAPLTRVPPPASESTQAEAAVRVKTVEAVQDAGAATGLGQVTVILSRDGKPVAGQRLLLRTDHREVLSRTTDVMGSASFDLPLGDWTVDEPADIAGRTIEVTRTPRRVELKLPPLRRVEGVVLEASGAPVAWLAITEGGDEPVATSDQKGRFAFDTIEPNLWLYAERGPLRAFAQVEAPASDVLLRLERRGPLRLLETSGRAYDFVVYASGDLLLNKRDSSGRNEFDMPLTELEVRATRFFVNRLQRAVHRVAPRNGEFDSVLLQFHDVPDITGLVRSEGGDPLASVTVTLRQLAPQSDSPHTQKAVTDAHGRFAFTPGHRYGGDPLYELHLEGQWKVRSAVRVRLGDGPVVLDAEPAPLP